MLRRSTATDDSRTVAMPGVEPGFAEFDVVLVPLSHQELGDIRIDDNLFAIGRTEPPFDAYPPELVADLSRRHARIFTERGAVYIADLDSKNGTTVNGVNVQQKIIRLRDGDEIGFGTALSYRVRLGTRVQNTQRISRLQSLTLMPEHNDLGLQPIVVTRFPFLISKADETFSRYKNDYPHQVNYISRRHAHIFLKSGAPFVEDLGSTNGTFVAGKRLDEHAVPLKDGDLLAFGGHHFVYKVILQKEEVEVDPTVTKLAPVAVAASQAAGVKGAAATPSASPAAPSMEELHNPDKTTFVAAADSFLDIFCIDRSPQQEDEVNVEEVEEDDRGRSANRKAANRKPRGKIAVFAAELAQAFAGDDRSSMKRVARWAGLLGAAAVMLVLAFYVGGASEREVRDMLADGEYAEAATAASGLLEKEPDNAQFQALGTEAILKANVPVWLAALNARDFNRAASVLAHMRELSRHHAGMPPLVRELESIGNIEQFVMGRGGPEAPIQVYAHEQQVKEVLQRWENDTQLHQSAFATISSHVPEFRDTYALALSHLRKLQSDDAVYLPAMERLKAAIESELGRDQPQALDAILKEYAEKYPRIGGLDVVRQDLRQYIDMETALQRRDLGAVVGLAEKVRFATPPFQAKFKALASSDRFPPDDIRKQYHQTLNSWRGGNAQQAIAGLESISGGAWGDAVAKEIQRKKTVAEQYAALQKARGSRGYDEKLLSFYGSLNTGEDTHFIRATETDLSQYKGRAINRAQELLGSAQAKWGQYRENGAIEAAQRLEGSISTRFRTQASLLSESQREAQQGMRIYTQLKTASPAQSAKLQEEIDTEMEAQRKALQDLRNVLEPRVLRAKLSLLEVSGGSSDDERRSPETTE
ncbi:MAG TPA: FHA domain-containing protein [Noviherbaspirillum sp.]|nr:FHA domain-containing protein [Noviherbaspirillum sp.]